MTTTAEDVQVQAPPANPVGRIRGALSAEVVKATAEKYGVCTRPFTMERPCHCIARFTPAWSSFQL